MTLFQSDTSAYRRRMAMKVLTISRVLSGMALDACAGAVTPVGAQMSDKGQTSVVVVPSVDIRSSRWRSPSQRVLSCPFPSVEIVEC